MDGAQAVTIERQVQYAIARAVYGQIRYAQGKPGDVPADITDIDSLADLLGSPGDTPQKRAGLLRPARYTRSDILSELNRMKPQD